MHIHIGTYTFSCICISEGLYMSLKVSKHEVKLLLPHHFNLNYVYFSRLCYKIL